MGHVVNLFLFRRRVRRKALGLVVEIEYLSGSEELVCLFGFGERHVVFLGDIQLFGEPDGLNRRLGTDGAASLLGRSGSRGRRTSCLHRGNDVGRWHRCDWSGYGAFSLLHRSQSGNGDKPGASGVKDGDGDSKGGGDGCVRKSIVVVVGVGRYLYAEIHRDSICLANPNGLGGQGLVGGRILFGTGRGLLLTRLVAFMKGSLCGKTKVGASLRS